MRVSHVYGLIPGLALALSISPLAGGCKSDNGGGGQNNSGGQTSTGGATSTGGSRSGGATGAGGTASTGGASSSGGNTASGGTTSAGGTTGSGDAAAGGGAGSGGATGGAGAGGTQASGGSTGNGGGVGSGGVGTGGGSAGKGGSGGTSGDAGADGPTAACGAEHFKDWPAGRSPTEVGLKLAKLFDSQAVDTSMHYKTACTWYGALDVAGLLKDASSTTLISKFNQLKTNFVANATQENHVDNSVFGIVPLEIYLQNSDTAVRDLGLAVADHQVTNIATQKRMAIDDMFMITGLQVQAYRAAPADKKMKYLDLAADTMVEYLKMQKTDGCFYQQEGANAKWGRGNGWFAVGMAEMMRELATTHKHYQTIRGAYEKMMKGLLDYQIKSGTGAGIWYQVIDSKDSRNWPETSGSAMFAYAMITGVKLCILDAATYGPAARAAWDTLTSSTYLGSDGKLKEISDWCYWTSGEGDALTYYITIDGRSRVVGDGHGQAPMLWAAAALLR